MCCKMCSKNARNDISGIKYCDILSFLILFMVIAVRFMTIFVMFEISEQTGQHIEKVTTAYESNPLAAISINLQRFGGVMHLILIGLLYGTYLFFRNRVKMAKLRPEILIYYVNVLFFTMLLNFFNDLSYFLAVLIK